MGWLRNFLEAFDSHEARGDDSREQDKAEIERLEQELNTKTVEFLMERKQRIRAENKVTELEEMQADDVYNRNSVRWRGLPTMQEMIDDGRAVKATGWPTVAKNQFGTMFSQFGITKSAGVIPYVNTGTLYYRIPKSVFMEIVHRSPIDEWMYQYENDKNKGQQFICGDFSFALMCMINLSPYWQVFMGAMLVQILPQNKGHWITLCWFSDDDRMYYLEPQTDKIWIPEWHAVKSPNKGYKPIQLVI